MCMNNDPLFGLQGSFAELNIVLKENKVKNKTQNYFK